MRHTTKAAKAGAVLITLLTALAACKPAERTLYTHRTDSVRVSRTDTILQIRTERDSVYLHDSVFVSQYAQGDTVYRVEHVTQWRDRISVKRDTLWRDRTLTEYTERTDTVYIQPPAAAKEKPPAWRELLARLALYAILLSAVWLWVGSRK